MKIVLKILGILALFLTSQKGYGQIKGRILEANGEPSVHAKIEVKNKKIITRSGNEGEFELPTAKINDTLIISSVKGEIQEIVADTDNIIFRFSSSIEEENQYLPISNESSKEIEGIVIVGYGKQKREFISGAISKISHEDIDNIPLATIDQLLAGKVSGLNFTSASGQPGTGLSSITLRGMGSISGGNNPLIIVEGVPYNLSLRGLNPDDIESITILKDASAKAIYGAKAGAGVILISLKKGKKNLAPQITYTGITSYTTKPQENKYNMLDSKGILALQQKLKIRNEIPQDLANVNEDWEDNMFDGGMGQRHELSIRGGGKDMGYYISLGYYDEEGLTHISNFTRFSNVINLDIDLKRNLRLGLRHSLSFSKSNRLNAEGSIDSGGIYMSNPTLGAILGMPYQSLYKSDGTLNTGAMRDAANAYELMLSDSYKYDELEGVSSVFLELDFAEYFTAKLQAGSNYMYKLQKIYTPADSYFGAVTNPGNQGSLSRDTYRGAIINTIGQVTYKRLFREKHNLEVSAFTEYTGENADLSGYTGYNLKPLLGNNPNAITVTEDALPVIRGQEDKLNSMSYALNANYVFNNKYSLNATIRREGSSAFGANNQWGTFWQAGLAWNIYREEFAENVKFINSLILRGAYGRSGKSFTDYNQLAYGDEWPYPNTTIYTPDSYGGEKAYYISSIAQPDFKWEKEDQYNLGLDFSLANRRVTGTLDVYYRRTFDLYLNKKLSETTGLDELNFYNEGEMVNKGIEFSISYDLIKKKDLKLSLFANIAYNKNEITDMGSVAPYQYATYLIEEGLSYGTYYLVKWAGVDPETGDPLYYDKNGNKTNIYSSENAVTDYGSAFAPWTGGFGISFNYKGWYLETLFDWKSDFYRINNERYFIENPAYANRFNQREIMLTEIWTTPGQVTDVQRAGTSVQLSSKFLENASFIRLRELEIGYIFSSKTLDELGLKSVRVFGIASNLFTWSDWTGYNPDGYNIGGFDYPNPRKYSFGVQVTF